MKKIFAAAILSAASASAIAADQGFYANVDAGQLSFTGNGASVWPKPGIITLGGGYHFNRNLGVEAGYSIVGDSTINTVVVGFGSSTDTMKTKIFQVAAVGTFPISEKFELFGKLGLANDKFDYSYSDTFGASAKLSASKTNLMYGIGGQFNINQHFGIRAQYQDFGKATFSGCTANCEIGATAFSVGGVYNF